jgi:hypothetical protein
MKKIAATCLFSIIGLSVTPPAMSAGTEFDQAPPPSSIECTDYQPGFGTALGDDNTSPPAVTPSVTPEISQASGSDSSDATKTHDPDPVDVTKAESERSELKPPIYPAATTTPKPDTPAAAIPEDPKPAVTVHPKKEPEVSEAPATVPTNRARRQWLSGYGTGIITNSIQAIAQAPRAIAQYTATEYHAGIEDMTNNGKTTWLKGPAALISLPFSIGAGIAEGTAQAFQYQEVDTPSPKLAESTEKKTQ